MTRRMQANPELSEHNHHGPEHDENQYCALGTIKCKPIGEKPVTDLADKIMHLPAHGTVALTLKDRVLDVVRGKVGVPDVGTYIVADGIVHEAAPRYVKERLRPGGRLWKWTLEAEELPTPFFEEGKTYRNRNDHGTSASRRFAVETVRGEGEGRVAFGCMSGADRIDRWTTRVEIDGWEEVR